MASSASQGSQSPGQAQAGGSGTAVSAASAANSPAAFAHIASGRAGDRQISARVHALRGCLDLLPADQHRLLDLRAGVGGPQQSLSRAAQTMGISQSKARSLQHRGLLALAELGGTGCGSSSSGSAISETIAVVTNGGSIAPLVSPATLVTSGPQLETPVALARPQRPQQQVLAAEASSPPQSAPAPAGVTRTVLSGATTGPTSISSALWGLLAALACAIALSALIARRRRSDLAPAGASFATAAPPAPLALPWRAEPPSAAPPVAPSAAPPAPVEPPPPPPAAAPPPPAEHAPPPPVEQAPPVPGFPSLPDGDASREIERTFKAPQPPPADSGPLREALDRPASPPPPAERLRHVSRPAAVIASGVLSIALRRLLRGRHR